MRLNVPMRPTRRATMHKGITDVSAGVFIAVTALLFLSQSTDLEGVSAILPHMLIIFMLIGSVYLIALGIVRLFKNSDATEEAEPVALNRIWIIGIGSIVYILLIPILGFYVTSGCFLFIMATILLNGSKNKKKAAALNLIFAVVLCVVVWGGFNVLLSVPTPAGILF